MTILPPELRKATEAYAAEMARIRAEQNWTSLETVKLGKAVGSQIVVDVASENDDPNVARRFINEVYYTSLDGTQTGRCIDNMSDHRAGRVVTIGYPPGRPQKEVYRVDVVAPVNPSSNEVGVNPHRSQHELVNYGYKTGDFTGKVGNDIPRVDDRQMWNVNVQPWDGMTPRIGHGWVTFGSSRQWYAGGTVTGLSAYVPVIPGMGRNVLVGLTRALNITCRYGNLFGFQYNDPADYFPAWDANDYPIAPILLEYGMTGITWAHIRPGVNLHAVPDVPRIYADFAYQLDLLEELLYLRT